MISIYFYLFFPNCVQPGNYQQLLVDPISPVKYTCTCVISKQYKNGDTVFSIWQFYNWKNPMESCTRIYNIYIFTL